MAKKTVELPPGCMITDRGTWERQRLRMSRLEHENRRLAERLQNLETANEALRRSIAEAEELAIQAMADAEQARAEASRGRLASDLALKALRTSRNTLGRVRASNGRSAFGGALTDAYDACQNALKAAAKIT